MITRLKVRLEFGSDFHIGTGAGLGRVVDAVVARTAAGEPVVPGSTLKGLARDAVRGLPEAIRTEEIVSRVFGLPGSMEGVVRFGNAVPENPYVPPAVHGRSARDRKRGRALDDALFRVEDAGACLMVATVVADEALGEREMVLLITALRRIEAIGGQRRRGKGRVSVSVEVLEGDGSWQGTRVPGEAKVFEAALRRRLGQCDPDRSAEPPSHFAPRTAVTEGSESSDTTIGSAWAVLWVLARADAPLVLSAVPEVGNRTRTLPHVTGTSLRGAIARSLLRRDWAPDDPRFQAAVVREQVHFGPLYPCDAWTEERSFPLPAPASLATCKYRPGLVADDPQAHDVVDLLVTDEPLERCSKCAKGAPLVPLGGFIQAASDAVQGGAVLHATDPAVRFAAHIRIDPATQRAEDHMLYGQEQVAAGSWFAGYLWGPARILDAIRGALDGKAVSVGKGRTRGHGELVLHLCTPVPMVTTHPVFPGILPFAKQSGSADQDTGSCDADAGADGHDTGFTLTLYSDLIVLDELLRPVTRLDAPSLWSLLGGDGAPPFELVRGYASTRTVLGFNGVPGRPRTPDVALVAGSTWRFQWNDRARHTEARLLLDRAQEQGLGLRRGEGFGRVLVDLPLHGGHLDQTRGRSDDSGLAVVLPSVPSGRQPVAELKPPPAPQLPDGLRASDVPEADRTGLARLLWRAAQDADPTARLKCAVSARRHRAKSGKGTDNWLRALTRGGGKPSFTDELRACALALDGEIATARGESKSGG